MSADVDPYLDEKIIQDVLEVIVRSHSPSALVTGWVLQLSFVEPGDLEYNSTGYQEYSAPGQSFHSALGLAHHLVRRVELWGEDGCVCGRGD